MRFGRLRRREGMNKQEIEQLQRSIETQDKTAKDLQAPSHFGTIEQLEEQHGPPWLRERRRRQRQQLAREAKKK